MPKINRTEINSSVTRVTRNKLVVVSIATPISARYGLLVEEATEYKAGVQPDIINSFASAAFRWESLTLICCLFKLQNQDGLCSRFGHSMINSMFMLVSQRKPRNQVTK